MNDVYKKSDTEQLFDNLLKMKKVIEYCEPHLEQMWAARISSILMGCCFRDVKDYLEDFYNYCEEIGVD